MGSCVFRIQFSDGQVEERELGDGRYQIGREAGDIVLRDPKSSAVHGELVIHGDAVTYTDLGSSNGSLDAQGRPLTAPMRLSPGQSVQLGNSAITYLRAPVLEKPRMAPTQPMEAVSGVAPGTTAAAPAAVRASGTRPTSQPPLPGGSAYSQPDRDVRHSYPLAITSAGIGESLSLLLKTLPFLLARFGILCALTVAGIVYWVVFYSGLLFFSRISSLLGWIWAIGLLVVAGSVWRFAVRYMLYLLKAAHIAVLTELITTGRIANGSQGMFEYGKRVVTERFGQVNAMFALDLLIGGIVGAFNRTLNWVASLLPIPGLDSVVGIVNQVLRASTTYIDETIFSYNLARGDENVFRSSKDGLIYYAQNAKEVLKTGLLVVVLDRVATVVIWVLMLAPGALVSWVLPGSTGGVLMVVAAVLFAGSVRSAFLQPLFLIMVMVKFHSVARNQPINLEWDQRLTGASTKFGELKQQAEAWVSPGRGPQPGAAHAA
ncbi:MAG: hypothetical protein RL033_7660 [Pseudomonadota bacterium]|jgi:pSer/pThr/pTyr-binding forkhead associated (FHA) protein